jgi:hypothetical protein
MCGRRGPTRRDGADVEAGRFVTRAVLQPRHEPRGRQLQAYHQEAFTDYLVAERALQIALHLDEDVASVREKRDDLHHLAAGYALPAANARRAEQS